MEAWFQKIAFLMLLDGLSLEQKQAHPVVTERTVI